MGKALSSSEPGRAPESKPWAAASAIAARTAALTAGSVDVGAVSEEIDAGISVIDARAAWTRRGRINPLDGAARAATAKRIFHRMLVGLAVKMGS